mmetsp:Transcript_100893/g.314530  ORF Transcript_100893/g.314530 Transcript_100893/m.314530 type:complete len:320 (-) Transcript_100893:15-974(-)
MASRRTLAPLLLCSVGRAWGGADVDPVQPVPATAKMGRQEFDAVAREAGGTMWGMTAAMQSNPLQFQELTDFWCAYELTDYKRRPALLIDDLQVEYEPYVRGIVPQIQLLISAFRKAGLPIFWSTWWRWGPDDGYFNAMDRFYGPVGYRTAANALYNHNKEHGGDILPEVGPTTEEERRRVMHKMYSLSMFDERPMHWLVPANQSTLHAELQRLGVDTVVQVGAWTDDCIISTAYQAFQLHYDVVVVEDGVSTASKQHFNALEVMRGSAAKVLVAQQVADYIDAGLPVVERPGTALSGKTKGGRAAAFPASLNVILLIL